MGERIPTRTRIVDAATMLFWRDGYHAVSTDQICRKAGVAKSSLYHAFPSKAEVLAACLDDVWTRDWSEISGIYKQSIPGREKLERHLQWFASSQLRIRENFGMILGTFDMALGVAIPIGVAHAIADHRRQHDDLLAEAIAGTAGLARDSARVQWLYELSSAVITSATINARIRNEMSPLLSLKDTVIQLIDMAASESESGGGD